MIEFETDFLVKYPERLKRPDFPLRATDGQTDYADRLDKCETLQEVFSLV